ncbi:MAG: preprotein translocase subunit SecE [Candidatus Blackburnbacteria bacterium]|nr:preprotein translocase subunit SecE [Candidatus Blackburnbacteria bacterium]
MNLFSYLQEVRSEMTKVVWPTRKQVFELTVLVIAISIIVGVYVGGLDFLFTNTLNKILGR